MWKNYIQRGRPQRTVWRMRNACWIPKATHTHTVCVLFIALPLQQCLHERASILRYMHTACIVKISNKISIYKRATVVWDAVRCNIRTCLHISVHIFRVRRRKNFKSIGVHWKRTFIDLVGISIKYLPIFYCVQNKTLWTTALIHQSDVLWV